MYRLTLSSRFLLRCANASTLPTRTIYTAESLGIDKIQSLRTKTTNLFGPGKDRYIQRINEFLNQDKTESVFNGDLVNMIALATQPEHLDIIEKLARILQSKSWGTELVKLYYKLDEVERALINIKDESYGSFFNQKSSYHIVMTMLYNKGRYADVVDLYEFFKKKLPTSPDKPPSHLANTAAAALAKLNTAEALEKAKKIIAEDLPVKGYIVRSRIISSTAYLALNQGEPGLALSTLTEGKDQFRNVLRNSLYVEALIRLERFEDINIFLKSLTNINFGDNRCILESVCDKIEASLQNDDQTSDSVKESISTLKGRGLVEKDGSLESLVFSNMNVSQPVDDMIKSLSWTSRQSRKKM